jgi:hypothetical protein
MQRRLVRCWAPSAGCPGRADHTDAYPILGLEYFIMDQNLSLMGAPPAPCPFPLLCSQAVRATAAGPGLSPLLGAPGHAGLRPAFCPS